jgi:hypothetical protein
MTSISDSYARDKHAAPMRHLRKESCGKWRRETAPFHRFLVSFSTQPQSSGSSLSFSRVQSQGSHRYERCEVLISRRGGIMSPLSRFSAVRNRTWTYILPLSKAKQHTPSDMSPTIATRRKHGAISSFLGCLEAEKVIVHVHSAFGSSEHTEAFEGSS